MTIKQRRMMRWTCRKCGQSWETRIPDSPKGHFPEGGKMVEMERTICDDCIDKMASESGLSLVGWEEML